MGDELKVSVGNGAKYVVKGVGTISFKTKEGLTRNLIDILWVPNLAKNLLYVAAITDQDLQVHFDKKEVIIAKSKNQIVAKGVRHNNIYKLLASTTQSDVGISRLWHERFGHLRMETLATM